jgi:hypothetical protein
MGRSESLEARFPDMVPPVDFTEADAPYWPLGAFAHAQSALGSESAAAGCFLGCDDQLTSERWEHLADDASACEVIKSSVLVHHILPRVQAFNGLERGQAAAALGGRYCTRSGKSALVVVGTARWDACVALARHLARRDEESDSSYAARCRRHDAWAAACAYERAGIALLILRQAVVFLGGVDLFAGVPQYHKAPLSADALYAHLRVPRRLRPVGCTLEKIFDPYWRSDPDGGPIGPAVVVAGRGGGGAVVAALADDDSDSTPTAAPRPGSGLVPPGFTYREGRGRDAAASPSSHEERRCARRDTRGCGGWASPRDENNNQ